MPSIDGDGCIGLTLDPSLQPDPGGDGLTACVPNQPGNTLTTVSPVPLDPSGPLQPGPGNALTVCISSDPSNALTTDDSG